MSIIPGETPGQKIEDAFDGRDDPNRGPIDRAANALDGVDDPNRGPVDRIENAMSGSTNTDDYVRTGTSATGGVISAVFDNQEEARQAVADLRNAGVDDASLSLIAQSGKTTTTSNADGDVIDEEHTSILRGILGGGALGAGLGVAALAIPGVGPLIAAGAIAASAVPGAMAIGAAVGAAAGTLNEALKSHGISDEDAAYYGEPMKSGGVLVAVNPTSRTGPDTIRDILYANGGHNAGRAKAM
jgi:hypothetical protein